METTDLQEFLGMVVHFVYYHHSRLYDDKVFEDDYWNHLLTIGEKKYWEKMYLCLDYALKTDNYCLDLVVSPFLSQYSESDIRLFFEKFHSFLKVNLNKE